MKPKKIESYDAGYSVSGVLKKAAVAASAAALLGGITGCGNSIMGDMEYQPPEYDGYMVVEGVSDSDISPNQSFSPYNSGSSEDEVFTLDGDVAYCSSYNKG